MTIPTQYKGIEFKSRFEANVAFMLQSLSLKWLYEPKSFLLPESGLHYMPDFYLPQIGLWVEVRGYELPSGPDKRIGEFARIINLGFITRAGKIIGQRFNLTSKSPDYLLIKSIPEGSNETIFFEDEERYGVRQSLEVVLAKCEACNSFYFFGTSGSYACRSCGKGNGNKHITEFKYLDVEEGQVYLGE